MAGLLEGRTVVTEQVFTGGLRPFPGVKRTENPVRADITAAARDYPFTGAVIPGFPDLAVHRDDYWEIFWTIHAGLLSENGYEG